MAAVNHPPCRVVLADDHELLRGALASLLDARSDVTVVGQASNGREAVDAAIQFGPDVILMDVAMPLLSGIEATRQIHSRLPRAKIIILSAYGDAQSVGQAMAAGASGFMIKRSDIDELVLALQLVMTGNTYFSRELTESLDVAEIVFAARQQSSSSFALTGREREVLQLIAEGHTMKAIAAMLVLSVKTVEGHNSRIMSKLGVRNRADLVRQAIGAGLVQFDSNAAGQDLAASG